MPTATYTHTPSPTLINTPTKVPTATPTEPSTPTSTATPINTLTPTASPSATPTTAPTLTPTIPPTMTPTQTPTLSPTATPTQRPTETATPTLSPTAVPTSTPTNTPTAQPTATPHPLACPSDATPNCDCTRGNTLNCADFPTHQHANQCYSYCMATAGYDVHELDGDNDGVACEYEVPQCVDLLGSSSLLDRQIVIQLDLNRVVMDWRLGTQ
ncbi:MAG: excalibur calcium-binding domain-containing protein [Chloroflexota bacterium]